MSKLNHKLNAKFVGVDAYGDPRFVEIAKKQNGITLIALIITIIVMLILTGVTLSITLGDNGLVNKAKEATEATELAMDRELLLSAVVGAIGLDGTVDYSVLDSKLPEGFTGSNGTYTSKNGNLFTVSSNGSITANGTGENNDIDTSKDLELLQGYFLGEVDEATGQRPGKVFTELISNPEIFEADEPDVNQIIFKDNEVIPDAHKSLIINKCGQHPNEDYEWFYMFYLKYNNNDYLVKTNDDFSINLVQVIEFTTDIDLYGTYYWNPLKKDKEYATLNSDSIILYYDENNKEEITFSSILIDKTNQIIVLDIGACFSYELIYENNEVVNKMIRVGDYSWMLQNINGLEFGLEGEYYSADGEYRLVFDNDSTTVNQEARSVDTWRVCVNNGNEFYFKYNGVYYISGEPIEVSEDLSQIVRGGITFIKQ